MTQNIYDDPTFFQGYSQMGRSLGGLDAAPEWPALLPPMNGFKVVDLGCGYGWLSRWGSEQGARQVLGLDVSQKMLATACASTSAGLCCMLEALLQRKTPGPAASEEFFLGQGPGQEIALGFVAAKGP